MIRQINLGSVTCMVHAVLFIQSVVVPWWPISTDTSVNVHSPSPSSHDCSHFTSGDSDTGCDRRLRPRGSHTCHSVGVLSGTPTDFSYLEVSRIEMAVRTEHQRNRNQLTTGHSCAGVDRGLSAYPPILLYIYCIIVSHIPVFAFRKLIVWLR